MPSPLIYWFRQDLRIKDNVTLTAAANTGRPIVCVYILDQNQNNHWPHGAASLWWLHHSLIQLSDSLKTLNIKLVLRKGSMIKELDNIIQTTKADSLYFTRHYEPYNYELENQINQQLFLCFGLLYP